MAVDAVLLIGEHGKYPVNNKAQMQYPRKQFFDATVEVFKRSGRVVPVFCDKHLSYRWDWAKEMFDTARAMKIPLMAGSSVPLAERRPPMELPADARIVEAVSIHGGGVESYDIHALEVLQSIVEARRGGETGVRAVQFMEAEALWKAAEEGRWSSDLAAAAMAAETGADHELVRSGIDEVIMFQPLMKKEIRGIIRIQLDNLKQLVLPTGINLQFSDYALDYLAENGYDPQYGARPLKRLIQKEIINQLSRKILSGDIDKTRPVLVDVFGGTVVFRNETPETEKKKATKK